jgi:hypothetical protein
VLFEIKAINPSSYNDFSVITQPVRELGGVAVALRCPTNPSILQQQEGLSSYILVFMNNQIRLN